MPQVSTWYHYHVDGLWGVLGLPLLLDPGMCNSQMGTWGRSIVFPLVPQASARLSGPPYQVPGAHLRSNYDGAGRCVCPHGKCVRRARQLTTGELHGRVP